MTMREVEDYVGLGEKATVVGVGRAGTRLDGGNAVGRGAGATGRAQMRGRTGDGRRPERWKCMATGREGLTVAVVGGGCRAARRSGHGDGLVGAESALQSGNSGGAAGEDQGGGMERDQKAEYSGTDGRVHVCGGVPFSGRKGDQDGASLQSACLYLRHSECANGECAAVYEGRARDSVL